MMKVYSLAFLCVFLYFPLYRQLHITSDTINETVIYSLQRLGTPYTLVPFSDRATADLIIFSSKGLQTNADQIISVSDFEAIQAQGYKFKHLSHTKALYLLYKNASGLTYGLAHIREVLQQGKDLSKIHSGTFNPHLPYRILKYNLPWSPYRNSEAITLHDTTCRDLRYWERFLDMMVDTRFNVLSLWNIHPFPYLIKSKSFPYANNFSEKEMAQWQLFWTELFKMARIRGIETFIVNWNIAVSPEFAKAYGVSEYSDLSEIVKRYTRESVTQVINEYPDLSGLGVTLADWMGTFDEKMTPQQREDWIEETFVQGMKAADRPVKFIHRSVLAGDPLAMRNLIDRAELTEPALVEIKFNWSHGHSTPTLAITHDYHSGKLDERFWSPKPSNYAIQWMIRNEDFFILRWGQPDFIRQHIKINTQDYVNGYFIGSEGYTPAVDYSSVHLVERTWTYAFEKQWLFYALWGRLLYDPTTPNSYFEALFDQKYGKESGEALFKAISLSSSMPLRLASFFRSTWDYTLYSEGFLAPEPSNTTGFFDRSSAFISIDEWIRHETLDPALISIQDYVTLLIHKEKPTKEKITPLQLADQSERDSKQALNLYTSWMKKNATNKTTLRSEWYDAATWSYLGLYLADKLRAGVDLEIFYLTGDLKSKQSAIRNLQQGLVHWDQVINLTKHRYKPTPHVAIGRYKATYPMFSWALLREQVLLDINLATKAVQKAKP